MNISLGLLAGAGFVVWLLMFLSVVALSVLIYKVWQFWFAYKISDSVADKARYFIQHSKWAEALLMVKGHKNPRAQSLAAAMLIVSEAKEANKASRMNGRGSESLTPNAVKDEVVRVARTIINKLTGQLKVLEVIAVVAPLLGLFGTVLGMIEAFQAMEAAGSQVNPAVLSGGIWKALLTTAVGMAVAIPATMAHSWLERRVEVEASALIDDIDWLMTHEYLKSGSTLVHVQGEQQAS